MIHPDKSKLSSEYFLFYKQAYEIILDIYKQKNRIQNAPLSATVYNPEVVKTKGIGNQQSETVNNYNPKEIQGKKFNDKFNELYDAALAAGNKLRNVGDYRSFEAQLGLFKERYRPAEDKDWANKKKGILNDPDRVKRTYEGETWLLRNGFAPCSTPGKSNHGYGLAIDVGVERAGKLVALASDKKAADWMCEHAPDFGFYLQSSDPSSREFEIWHWQYAG
jgi:LAS superfamily LD-carboxypeptidase LdcB